MFSSSSRERSVWGVFSNRSSHRGPGEVGRKLKSSQSLPALKVGAKSTLNPADMKGINFSGIHVCKWCASWFFSSIAHLASAFSKTFAIPDGYPKAPSQRLGNIGGIFATLI